MSEPLRMAVMISGTGSNLKCLIEAIAAGQLNAGIVQVISNRPDAGGLVHARDAGVPATVIDRGMAGGNPQREDELVAQCLREARPELVLLSGYMRIVGAALVDEFAGRMINQHPSLLPRFKGLNTYARALAAGDTEHGASIHFVTAELDGGPVIAQVRIPVRQDDTAVQLATRLAPLEHRLLLAVVRAFSHRQLNLDPAGVVYDGKLLHRPLQLQKDVLDEHSD